MYRLAMLGFVIARVGCERPDSELLPAAKEKPAHELCRRGTMHYVIR